MLIKGVLIDVENNIAESVEIEATLDNYYKLLNCDVIDIVNREINGKRFDIVCDDEGLLKENPKISALDLQYKPTLVGNLFVCHVDVTGQECSLSEEEINHILECVRLLGTRKHPTPYPMLTKVNY